jgi:hypothetical protein
VTLIARAVALFDQVEILTGGATCVRNYCGVMIATR